MSQANQLSTISRRDALKLGLTVVGAAAALAVPAGAVLAATKHDPIFAAIEAHRRAVAAWDLASDELEELEGRLPRDVLEEVWREPRTPIVMGLTPDMDANNLLPDTKIRWCQDAEQIAATLPAWGNRQRTMELALADLEEDRRKLEATRAACGYTAAEAAQDAAKEAAEAAAVAILDVKPTTLAGVVALLTYAADYCKTGWEWPTDLFDDDEIKYDPRYPNESGRDWSFYLHRMLAEALPAMAV